MPEESLITPEVRALVGRESPAVPVRVTRRAVERTLELYQGAHPGTLEPGKPVTSFVLVALDNEAEAIDVPQLLPDSLLISNEMEFDRQIVLGDDLMATWRVADISERFGGRFGYSVYVRTETVFRDPVGNPVARSARTMMHYDARNAAGGEEP